MQTFIASKTNDNEDICSLSEHRDELIEEIFVCLYGLSNVIDVQSREIKKLTGFSMNVALTIKTVSRSPSVHVSELARSMYLNPATMVRILDRLEEQRLITRMRSKKDRRVVKVKLSENATDVELALRNITHKSLTRCFEATDDSELLNMLKAVQRLS